jgi:hypothetical protein
MTMKEKMKAKMAAKLAAKSGGSGAPVEAPAVNPPQVAAPAVNPAEVKVIVGDPPTELTPTLDFEIGEASEWPIEVLEKPKNTAKKQVKVIVGDPPTELTPKKQKTSTEVQVPSTCQVVITFPGGKLEKQVSVDTAMTLVGMLVND